MKISCAVCLSDFDAKASTARYCSPRCQKLARRGTGARGNSTLVRAVAADLERCGVLDSYAGQLALQLARQMSTPGATGLPALSRVCTVMTEALGPAAPAPEAVEPAAVEAPDIVDEVRRKREQRQASAAAG